MDDIELNQAMHRIKEHPTSEKQGDTKDLLMIPYTPLPLEILPMDNKCDVHLFSAGINVVITDFIREVQKADGSIRLTELEWLAKFEQFVEARKVQSEKALKR